MSELLRKECEKYENVGLERGLEIGEKQGLEKGLEWGLEKGKLESLRNLMKNGDMDKETAMALLGFTLQEKNLFREVCW